jgi:molecular chaperone Hsp33
MSEPQGVSSQQGARGFSEIPNGRWVKSITTTGTIRGVAIEATALIQGVGDLHQVSGATLQGLGEALLSGLLLSSYLKVGDRVNLNIQGTGQFVQALVDAYPEGHFRGYVIPRSVEAVKLGADGQMGPWGEGLMSVLKTKDTLGEKPYIGTVPLVTGHLAKDLAFYWHQSEQVPSAVGIEVKMDGARVSSAVAFLIQAMPGAADLELKEIEAHIAEMGGLFGFTQKYESPVALLAQVFQNSQFLILEERDLRFDCSCSWDRVYRAVALTGVKELEDMLASTEEVSVACDFCTRNYSVSKDQLRRLLAKT